MTVYAGMLKGINVGKSHRIKMEDLKRLLLSIGLSNVETYIQSGNFIFEADGTEQAISRKIGEGIEDEFGFSSAVVLRTADELGRIVNGCPFTPEEISLAEKANSEGESLYVVLLGEIPQEMTSNKFEMLRGENEDFRIMDRNVYLLLGHSIRNSKLAGSLQKMEENSTVRNWKTIKKLDELAGKRK